jgi:hypothetical protein
MRAERDDFTFCSGENVVALKMTAGRSSPQS